MEFHKIKLIRYPGGKQRIISHILPYLPSNDQIKGFFIEPFVGGGSTFFALDPKRSRLSDINPELITLYRGIRKNPEEIWEIYKNFPSTKKGYYEIRGMKLYNKDTLFKAARILYLNRTCFKGMWRHNSRGEFNIGYGGQDRRWVICKEDMIEVSNRLKKAVLKCSDFEIIINNAKQNDFIFLDPPYRPGEKKLLIPIMFIANSILMIIKD